MSTRRHLLKSLAAAPLGAPLAARAQLDGKSKVLRYAFEIAETGFDPAQLSDLYSRIVTGHIFDGPYRYDHLARPYKIKPNTAAAMPEISDDFRVWTIRLAPGIFFHDDPVFNGKPRELVAEDYVYTFKRIADPRWKAPSWASIAEQRILGLNELRDAALKEKKRFDYDRPVEGLRALDRYTLQFKLADPKPRFLQLLCSGDLYGAVAREVVEKYADDIMAHPIGTGPYRLAEWRRSSKIVLTRHPNFRRWVFDGEPNADDADGQALAKRLAGRSLPIIDRVEISIVEETQPRWLSFLNGRFDFLERVPFEFADVAIPNNTLAPNLAKRGIQMVRSLASDVTLTYFNMEDPVVGGYEPAQVALRRALGMAVNIDEEIRLYWKGQAVPAHAGMLPFTTGFDNNFRTEFSGYNLPGAKALLDMYGFVDRDGDGWRERPDGSPLELVCASVPDQRTRQRDEFRRRDMNALGVRVRFVPAKWPDNLKNARAGKLMMWNLGLSAAAPDGLPAHYRGATIHKGGQNLARFSNTRFDEIFTQLGTLPDGPERNALFREANRIMAAYAPYKFHVHRIITDLAQPWLIGYRRAPFWKEWWHFADVDAEAQAEAV
jgi:ABC-type transport system substrate-binding protein